MDSIGATYFGQYYADSSETTPTPIAGDNVVWEDKWETEATTRRTNWDLPDKYRRQ